jgi:hypothetical protein
MQVYVVGDRGKTKQDRRRRVIFQFGDNGAAVVPRKTRYCENKLYDATDRNSDYILIHFID